MRFWVFTASWKWFVLGRRAVSMAKRQISVHGSRDRYQLSQTFHSCRLLFCRRRLIHDAFCKAPLHVSFHWRQVLSFNNLRWYSSTSWRPWMPESTVRVCARVSIVDALPWAEEEDSERVTGSPLDGRQQSQLLLKYRFLRVVQCSALNKWITYFTSRDCLAVSISFYLCQFILFWCYSIQAINWETPFWISRYSWTFLSSISYGNTAQIMRSAPDATELNL